MAKIKKLMIVIITLCGYFILTGFMYGDTPSGYTVITTADIGLKNYVTVDNEYRFYEPVTLPHPADVTEVLWDNGGKFGMFYTIDEDVVYLGYRGETGGDPIVIYYYYLDTATAGTVDTDYVYIAERQEISSVTQGNYNLLYKRTISSYNVTFDLNGASGTAPGTQAVGYGYTPADVTAPTRENYIFKGWNLGTSYTYGRNASDFTITGNTTLFAIWKYNLFNVNYNTNGGNTITALLDVNKLPNTLPIPIKDGYTFLGWYYENDFTTLAVGGTVLDDDVILYAKYIITNQPAGYHIRYYSNGGTSIQGTDTATKLPNPLPIPLKEGFYFLGWYCDENFTILAVAGAKLNNNAFLYAKYVEIASSSDDFLAGWNSGFNNGYHTGRVEGYDYGYKVGAENGIDINWFLKILSGVAILFSIKIFGDVTLATFLAIPLVFGIVLWIIKLLRG